MLTIVGDRWTLSIIHELSSGPRRTLELLGAFTGLSSKTLANRLKKLERSGVVRRTSFPESPPRVEYSLTGKGCELLPVVEAISDVGEVWKIEIPSGARPCRPCSRGRGIPKDQPRQGSERRTPASKTARKRTDVTLL